MQLFPQHITIHSQLINIKDIKRYNIDEKIVDFLISWYDDNDYITVKTSGSTGEPKAIQLAKSFIADSAKRTIDFFNLKKNDPILLCLPTEFIAGKLMIVRALIGELDLHHVPPTSDFSFLSQRIKPFVFVAMVPNQVNKLLGNPRLFDSIKTLLIGGSAIPHKIEQQLHNVATQCYSSYGMTETATHIALKSLNRNDKNSCYQCLNGIEVSLSNDCLTIHIAGLSQDIITNDIAHIIDKSHFEILGRADNVIICGGIKLIPEVLEKKLQAFKEDEKRRTELTNIMAQQLGKYERAKKIFFIKQFKKTKTDKIIKKLLSYNLRVL
ncbi:MAG: acyl-CoA synthetase [Bacteroidia bacterium]|nr:MAG: acyl-CoA synthetase [Bacteroidia bacterium]